LLLIILHRDRRLIGKFLLLLSKEVIKASSWRRRPGTVELSFLRGSAGAHGEGEENEFYPILSHFFITKALPIFPNISPKISLPKALLLRRTQLSCCREGRMLDAVIEIRGSRVATRSPNRGADPG